MVAARVWGYIPSRARFQITPNDRELDTSSQQGRKELIQEPGRCKGPAMRWKYLILA